MTIHHTASACALDTAERYFKHQVDFTFIEPYPELLYSLLNKDDRRSVKVLPVNIQNVDINIFKTLESGDILSIDSTHVLKTGSDVHFEIFEVLPILNKGVIVHIHDIFWPFEYPRSWVIDEKRSWNEIYAVRALLMYQETFQIKFFNDFFAQEFRPRVQNEYPNFLKNSGGSLWLQKVE